MAKDKQCLGRAERQCKCSVILVGTPVIRRGFLKSCDCLLDYMEKRVAKHLPFMASVLETQMPPTRTPSTHRTSTFAVPMKTYWFVLQVSEKVLANEGVLLLKVQRKWNDSLYNSRLLWDNLSHDLISVCICLHFRHHPVRMFFYRN